MEENGMFYIEKKKIYKKELLKLKVKLFQKLV